eukprot:3399846-Rhodomonas_salina.1
MAALMVIYGGNAPIYGCASHVCSTDARQFMLFMASGLFSVLRFIGAILAFAAPMLAFIAARHNGSGDPCVSTHTHTHKHARARTHTHTRMLAVQCGSAATSEMR